MKESIVGTGLTKRARRTISSRDADANEQMHKMVRRKHWGYDGAARGTVENLVKTLKKKGLPYLDKTIVLEGDDWRFLRDDESEIDVARTAGLSNFFEIKCGYQSFEWYAGKIIELAQEALDEQNIPAAIELGFQMRELGFKEIHEPDAIHGRKFPRKPSDETKKKRKPKRSAQEREKSVLGMAQSFLNLGGFRHRNGKPHASDLAKECEKMSKKLGIKVGWESARKIISEAIRLGDLV